MKSAGSAFIQWIHATGWAEGQYLGHLSLYLIIWSRFDEWLQLLGYLYNMAQSLTWNYVCRSVTCISWFSDFALYLEDHSMDKCHNWFHVMQIFTLLNVCGSVTYISWSSDFVLSWRLFDGQMSNLGYWFHVMPGMILLNVCGSVTHISWSSDFVLNLED